MPRSVIQLLKEQEEKNNEASQRFLCRRKKRLTVAKNAEKSNVLRLP
jgi:hypothetical protein